MNGYCYNTIVSFYRFLRFLKRTKFKYSNDSSRRRDPWTFNEATGDFNADATQPLCGAAKRASVYGNLIVKRNGLPIVDNGTPLACSFRTVSCLEADSRAGRASWCHYEARQTECHPNRWDWRWSLSRMAPRSHQGSRKRPQLRVPYPRIARRSRHLVQWSTASTSPRLTVDAAHGVPGPPMLRNQAQRVNMPQTSLDLFSLSSYTGSSRHRVARLSTLTRITSLSFSPSIFSIVFYYIHLFLCLPLL